MSLLTDQDFMREALLEAQKAYAKGEIPIGAVIVREGKIIARDHNRREELHDPTAHAEILVMRKAGEILGGWRLPETTVYVTIEPCPMCAGALVQARVGRLVRRPHLRPVPWIPFTTLLRMNGLTIAWL